MLCTTCFYYVRTYISTSGLAAHGCDMLQLDTDSMAWVFLSSAPLLLRYCTPSPSTEYVVVRKSPQSTFESQGV